MRSIYRLSARNELILLLELWYGVWRPERLSVPDHEFHMNASVDLAAGQSEPTTGYGSSGHKHMVCYGINYPKEMVLLCYSANYQYQLYPVACAWKGNVFHVNSNNKAVVAVINSGYCKNTQLMCMLPCPGST